MRRKESLNPSYALDVEDTEDSINEKIMEDKAIPELRLKYDIFRCMTEMLINERNYLERCITEGRGINPTYKIRFMLSIRILFTILKEMMTQNKKPENWTETQKKSYQLLLKLEKNPLTKTKTTELIEARILIMEKLHELNLTNLLIAGQNPFDEFKLLR